MVDPTEYPMKAQLANATDGDLVYRPLLNLTSSGIDDALPSEWPATYASPACRREKNKLRSWLIYKHLHQTEISAAKTLPCIHKCME